MITIISGSGNTTGSTPVDIDFSKGPRKLIVAIWGTFGGSTVSLELSPDSGTTFVPMTSDINSILISTTSAKTFSFWASGPYKLRGVVSGGTANSVNITLL